MAIPMKKSKTAARSVRLSSATSVLKRHFAGVDVAKLIAASREYPIPARVDLQRALDEMLPTFSVPKQSGLHVEHAFETLTLGHLLSNQHSQVVIGPLQYQEIDVGEISPVQCARRALWLAKD